MDLTTWAVVALVLIGTFAVERLFLRKKWMKPDKEVNAGWAFARWRLLFFGVALIVFPISLILSR